MLQPTARARRCRSSHFPPRRVVVIGPSFSDSSLKWTRCNVSAVGDCTSCHSSITTAQQNVIDRILDHLGESPELPWSRGPPKLYALQLAQQHVEANPHIYEGFDTGDASYDQDAAWSSGEWEDA